MEPAYEIRSIADQILDEFLEQLSQDGEIPPALIERLRRLARSGEMTSGNEVLRAITSDMGEEP